MIRSYWVCVWRLHEWWWWWFGGQCMLWRHRNSLEGNSCRLEEKPKYPFSHFLLFLSLQITSRLKSVSSKTLDEGSCLILEDVWILHQFFFDYDTRHSCLLWRTPSKPSKPNAQVQEQQRKKMGRGEKLARANLTKKWLKIGVERVFSRRYLTWSMCSTEWRRKQQQETSMFTTSLVGHQANKHACPVVFHRSGGWILSKMAKAPNISKVWLDLPFRLPSPMAKRETSFRWKVLTISFVSFPLPLPSPNVHYIVVVVVVVDNQATSTTTFIEVIKGTHKDRPESIREDNFEKEKDFKLKAQVKSSVLRARVSMDPCLKLGFTRTKNEEKKYPNSLWAMFSLRLGSVTKITYANKRASGDIHLRIRGDAAAVVVDKDLAWDCIFSFPKQQGNATRLEGMIWWWNNVR